MARSAMTKVQPETAVGEGLALGCLSLGVTAVSSQRMAVELATAPVWRGWPAADLPVYQCGPRGGPRAGDGLPDLAHKQSQEGARSLVWCDCNDLYEPVLAETWDVGDAAEILEGSTGFGLSTWVTLAQRFVAEFGEGEIWYVQV